VEPGPKSDEMRGHFYDVESGFVSLPIRLPFTNYYRGLQVSHYEVLGINSVSAWPV